MFWACSEPSDAADAAVPADGGAPGDAAVPDASSPDAAVLSKIMLHTGSAGGAGNLDGARRDARFSGPSGVARADDGTFYIADTSNYTIRKISPDGMISTFAGASGKDGVADGIGGAARFSLPVSLVIDPDGNLIVSDSYAGTLRKITPEGVVSTWTGKAGENTTLDGPLAVARFRAPEGLAFDGAGNLYVADREAHTIRKIDRKGMVSTFAGRDGVFGADDGPRASALLNGPFAIAARADGALAIADTGSNTIRMVAVSGAVTTLAGLPGAGQDTTDGTGSAARFGRPRALVFDADGALIVADTFNDRLRRVSSEGVVSTWAGQNAGSRDGALLDAQFSFPSALLFVREGETDALYCVDNGSSILRRIAGGAVETYAGTAVELGQIDGEGAAARFYAPAGILLRPDGSLIVADSYNHALRAVSAEGRVETLGGSIDHPELVDGPLAEARFNVPRFFLDDRAGGYYLADSGNNVIRHVDSLGEVTTFAGGPVSRGNTHADGPLLEARFQAPGGMAMDSIGNIYLADSGNHSIRKIGIDGLVSTIAGDSRPGFMDGEDRATRFNVPDDLLLLDDHTLLVSDAHNHALRLVTIEAERVVVSTFAGTPADELEQPKKGDKDGVGTQASFNTPRGLLRDGDSVLIADSNNNLLRRVNLADATVSTVAGTRGRYGVAENELPGVLFEPQAMVRMPDQKLIVTFLGGTLLIEGL